MSKNTSSMIQPIIFTMKPLPLKEAGMIIFRNLGFKKKKITVFANENKW